MEMEELGVEKEILADILHKHEEVQPASFEPTKKELEIPVPEQKVKKRYPASDLELEIKTVPV